MKKKSKLDHNPDNAVKSELEIANEIILNASQQRKEQEGLNTIIKGNSIIHKRTPKDYKLIWKAFIKPYKLRDEEGKILNEKTSEAIEFKAQFDYGIEDIEKIGIEKFIDSMDWRNAADVVKWRTDSLHIVVCKNCCDDFGLFEYGALCPKCTPLFNMKKLSEDCAKAEAKEHAGSFKMLASFILEKEVRELYRIK